MERGGFDLGLDYWRFMDWFSGKKKRDGKRCNWISNSSYRTPRALQQGAFELSGQTTLARYSRQVELLLHVARLHGWTVDG